MLAGLRLFCVLCGALRINAAAQEPKGDWPDCSLLPLFKTTSVNEGSVDAHIHFGKWTKDRNVRLFFRHEHITALNVQNAILSGITNDGHGGTVVHLILDADTDRCNTAAGAAGSANCQQEKALKS